MNNFNSIKQIFLYAQQDFNFFTKHILKILNKNYQLSSLIFNKEQLYINKLLNQQKQQQRQVKAIILKGRQVGITTLIAARNYYFNLMNKGVKSLAITHRKSSTNNIYEMLNRFYQNSPFFLSQV
ncbi:hypothetical protein ACFX5K_02815 [Rickettsiales bacterium LUAb2]